MFRQADHPASFMIWTALAWLNCRRAASMGALCIPKDLDTFSKVSPSSSYNLAAFQGCMSEVFPCTMVPAADCNCLRVQAIESSRVHVGWSAGDSSSEAAWGAVRRPCIVNPNRCIQKVSLGRLTVARAALLGGRLKASFAQSHAGLEAIQHVL